MLVFVPLVFSLLSLVISENKVILNHINHREFLMLGCNITDDGCCQNMKEVEFFKNGKGVCTLIGCNGLYSIPLTRDDTRHYKCGCVEREIRNSYLHVTKSRPSDFGNWTCGCLDEAGGRNCNSSVMVISKEIFGKDVKISGQKSTTSTAYLQYLLFFVGFVLAVIIIVLVVVIIFLRRCVSKHVIVTRPIRLTKFLFGKKENVEEREDNPLYKIPLVTPNNQRGTTTLIPLLNSGRVDDAGLARRELQSLFYNIQNFIDDARVAQRDVQSLLLTKEIQNDVMIDDAWLAQTKLQSLLDKIQNVVSILVYKSPSSVDTPDWCRCGNCRKMKHKFQSLCCRNQGVQEGCFTSSWNFRSQCLSKFAVYKFFQSIQEGESNLKPYVVAQLKRNVRLTVEDCNDDVPNILQTNRSFRTISYIICNKVLPIPKYDSFLSVPSCCKLAIKEFFPDPDAEYDT